MVPVLKAVLTMVRGLGVPETGALDDPQREAKALWVDYLVQCEGMATEDATRVIHDLTSPLATMLSNEAVVSEAVQEVSPASPVW
jgi:hypothetical protein